MFLMQVPLAKMKCTFGKHVIYHDDGGTITERHVNAIVNQTHHEDRSFSYSTGSETYNYARRDKQA